MGKFSQYRLQFSDEWKSDPLFQNWVEQVNDDHLKAYCRYCCLFLPAHYAGLMNHAAGSKHCRNAVHFENRPFDLAATVPMMSQKLRGSSDRSDVRKSFRPRKVQSSEVDVEQDEGSCTLELTVEDETASCRVGSFNANSKNKRENPSIKVLKRTRRDEETVMGRNGEDMKTSEEEQQRFSLTTNSKMFKLSLETELVMDGKAEFNCSGLLQNRKPQDPKKRTRTLHSRDKQDLSAADDFANKVAEQQKTTSNSEDIVSCKQETIDDDATENGDQAIGESAQVRFAHLNNSQLKDVRSLMSSGDSSVWLSQTEPVDIRANIDDAVSVKRYPQKYVMRWNDDPVLRDWVAPVPGNVYRAKCRWCLVELRAHYKDLKHHAESTKHANSAAATLASHDSKNRVSEEEFSQADKDSSNLGATKTFKRSNNFTEQKSKQNPCYFLSRSSWDRYKQKYRTAWELDPNFCGWIAPVDGDIFRARCVYCRVLIRAHHRDLKEHSKTTKHATNVAYGMPYGGSGGARQAGNGGGLTALPRPKLTRRRAVVRQRRKLGSSSTSVPYSEEFGQNCCLLRPDDTLTSVDNLVSLATAAYSTPGESAVTTLVFPNATRLDESVAAALPNNPKTLYRVKKLSSPSGALSAKNRTSDSSAGAQCEQVKHLVKRVTLWEFLRMKVDRRSDDGGLRIPDLLSEFEAMYDQVKRLTDECLEPIALKNSSTNSSPDPNSIMVLSSDRLAKLLGISVGHYRIKDSAAGVDDGPCSDLMEKPKREHSEASTVDLALVPVQSVENYIPNDHLHSALFPADRIDQPEGVLTDPQLIFSSADHHVIQLQDADCLAPNADGNSLLYTNADGTLYIQVNGSGDPQIPLNVIQSLFSAKDEDPKRTNGDPLGAELS